MPGTCTLQLCVGSGEDGMFSLIRAKDLITAAKATCLSFQPGAGPVQGVVLPLQWPGSRSPSNSAVRWLGHALGDHLFSAAGWGWKGRRTKCCRGKEVHGVPGLFGSGAELGMWLLWPVPSGSLRLPSMWLRKLCRTEVVAANSHLGSSKAAPRPCGWVGQQQAHPFSGGCCSLLRAEMTQEQVR